MHKFLVWIKRVVVLLLIFLLFATVERIFGADNAVIAFIKDKFVFTPYNMVGFVMVILAPFGIWVGRKGGGKLLSIISTVALMLSIVSFIGGILKIFNYGIGANISANIQKVAIFVGVFLLAVAAIIITIKIIQFGINKHDNKNNNSLPKKQINAKRNFQVSKTIQLEKKESTADVLKTLEITPCAGDFQMDIGASLINNIAFNDDLDKNEIVRAIESIHSYEHKVANRICPICGAKLKSRQNRESGKWFVGCENYFTEVNCNFTIDYPTYKKFRHKNG